jgi:hypothetical protein
MKQPKLIVIQLNELNFDVVRSYLGSHSLPGFRALLSDFTFKETFAEQQYEHLEPWIQWVSAHTGRTFEEHKVFRLGDINKTTFPQIFEVLEKKGLRVGAISPMNARNELRSAAYFIPDPWTDTPSDASGFSRRISEMLRQTVNANSQSKISGRSLVSLLEALARTLNPVRTLQLLKLVARSRGRPWIRALVLDQLIHMIHMMLIRKQSPDVSFVFLNAGAHIQHHYYFNSRVAGSHRANPEWYVSGKEDPVLDMVKVYDRIIDSYLAFVRNGTRVIFATGLTQVPFDRLKYYYRLRSHGDFLHELGIGFARVNPRMTRDFEVIIPEVSERHRALHVLRSVQVRRDGRPLFGEMEERNDGLFVTLNYPDEILKDDIADYDGGSVSDLGGKVTCVGVKNGMHSGKGFVYVSPNSPQVDASPVPVHVSYLFQLTQDLAR